MSNHRRVVRVSRDVFDELDLVLGPERGEDGTPSANDLLTIDLLPVVDAFATRRRHRDGSTSRSWNTLCDGGGSAPTRSTDRTCAASRTPMRRSLEDVVETTTAVELIGRLSHPTVEMLEGIPGIVVIGAR